MGLFHSRHSDLERKSTGVSNNKDDGQFGFMIYTCASLPATCSHVLKAVIKVRRDEFTFFIDNLLIYVSASAF